MELTGKIIQILAPQSGVGKNGPWKKCDFIIETGDKFPKKVCVTAWNELADQIQKEPIGTEINVSIDLSSREYNGKWYNDIKAWKISNTGSTRTEATPEERIPDGEDLDVLPF